MKKESPLSINFFLELRTRFTFCKKVLLSCQTIEQAYNCDRWFVKVFTVMENKMYHIQNDLSISESKNIFNKFKDEFKAMLNDWRKLVDETRERITLTTLKSTAYRKNDIGFHD